MICQNIVAEMTMSQLCPFPILISLFVCCHTRGLAKSKELKLAALVEFLIVLPFHLAVVDKALLLKLVLCATVSWRGPLLPHLLQTPEIRKLLFVPRSYSHTISTHLPPICILFFKSPFTEKGNVFKHWLPGADVIRIS